METRPYGSWTSPISSERIAAGSLRLSQPRLDRGVLYWVEGRPAEGGRQVIVRDAGDAVPRDATPPDMNARTLVHEYGGGDYCVRDGAVFFCNFDDQRVYRIDARGGEPAPVSKGDARYADLEPSPDGRWLVAVEERPREGREPENRIVALPLAGPSAPRVVASGFDFVSSPRFSPDGRRLAFTAWDHPQTPWDGSSLWVVSFEARGAAPPRLVAGGRTESIFQPSFSPGGRLTFVSDRSGWWNLYQTRETRIAALCPQAAEFGQPQWVFGLSTYDFLDERSLLCAVGSGPADRLCRLDLASGALEELDVPYREISGLRVEGPRACFLGASATRPAAVCTLDWRSGALREHRSSLDFEVDSAFVSVPESISFSTSEGETAHAHVYLPRNPEFAAGSGERPPLLVKGHGGPTGSASTVLAPRIQYWTTRGFAVADVDYRGSTGYGRAYRERLRGRWGELDVADCIAAARHLAEQGRVDGERLAISGGSAGGFTVLCALTFHDLFRAGASHYGIGDLEALARDTHKFESRYLDGLIGPYPERKDLYVSRSPIHFAERLSCPVIFFQGLDDRIVPPSQTEAMVAALARRKIPHAYVPFPGEQHGFRKAENIRTALDGELFFYAFVFGFAVNVRPEAVRIVR